MHLRKHGGISIAWANEFFQGNEGAPKDESRQLFKIAGFSNPADLLTKPLERTTFMRHVAGMNMDYGECPEDSMESPDPKALWSMIRPKEVDQKRVAELTAAFIKLDPKIDL